MAKNATYFYDAAVETSPRAAKGRDENSQSIFQTALDRISGFLSTQQDRDVEDFIKARGG